MDVKKLSSTLFLLITFLSINLVACQTTTNYIDKDIKLKDLSEPQWFKDNIPFVDLPNKEIEEVYYYRWSSLKRHLRYIAPGVGYIVAEQIFKASYSKKFSSLNGAAGHHIYESRWLRNPRFVEDYINFWAREGSTGNQQYSEWIADAAWATYLLTGNKPFIKSQQQGFIKNFNDWDKKFDKNLNLYFISPHDDAMQHSASSLKTKDPFRGGTGFRPSLNSELYANALAISKIARLNNDPQTTEEFEKRAEAIRKGILDYLWDDERQFFYHMYSQNNANHSLTDTRENIGFFPWRFGVPPTQDLKYQEAWKHLFDPRGFNSTYGPTTCEQRSPWFDGKQTKQCCWWNGNSWPYSTSHIIKSLASQIKNYGVTDEANIDNFSEMFQKYAKTQYRNGKPYIGMCHSPYKKIWVCDPSNNAADYAHSTYIDNVLGDLIGIEPQADNTLVINPLIPSTWKYFAVENLPYHGHTLTVLYDKDGTKYNNLAGMQVFLNGEAIAGQAHLGRLSVRIPCQSVKDSFGGKRRENYAANVEGNGYPKPEASFTGVHTDVWQAVDGRIIYDYQPSNRWTNWNSRNSNAKDWFSIDFGPGREKRINEVKIYVYSDVVTGQGQVDCPKSIKVEVFKKTSGKWENVSNQSMNPSICIPNDVLTINFDEVKTQKIRLTFTRKGNSFVGMTEVEIWATWPQTGNGNEGEYYEAEDGVVTHANIRETSTGSGGSFVGQIDFDDSTVEFPGIWVDKNGEYEVRVYYCNQLQDATQEVTVNNLHKITANFPHTKGKSWGQFDNKTYAVIRVQLLRGNNVLIFKHKKNYAELDKIGVFSIGNRCAINKQRCMLEGEILKFEITAAENQKLKPSKIEKIGEEKVLVNEGASSNIQKVFFHKTITDKIEVSRIPSNQFSRLSLSNSTIVNSFSDNFIDIFKAPFSSSYRKNIDEEITFVENLKQRIQTNLISTYQNRLTNARQSHRSEITKEFFISKAIAVPSCTESKVTAFLRTNTDLPIHYSTLIEIKGGIKDENGSESQLTAEELQQALDDEMKFIEAKGDHTIIARESGTIFLDLSFYSKSKVEGKEIDGCKELNAIETNKAKITFFDDPNFQNAIYRGRVNGSCQTLPYSAKGKAESVETDVCVLLFESESCDKNPGEGASFKLNPRQGRLLPLFGNLAQSFQSCENYKRRESAKSDDKDEVKFYRESSSGQNNEIATSVLSKKCTNLPAIAKNKVSSVETSKCLKIYEDEFCFGRNFTLRPHLGVKLDQQQNLAGSFNACTNFIPKKVPAMDNLFTLPHLQLFENEDQTSILINAPIREYCTTPKMNVWQKTASIATESCVQLFTLQYCQGFSTEVYPGNQLDQEFLKKIVSFTKCEEGNSLSLLGQDEDEEQISAHEQRTNFITFYDNPYFKDVLYKTEVDGTCQVLPPCKRSRIESIQTRECVILFPTENCHSNGFSFRLLPDQGAFFPFFANAAQSFQSCEAYEDSKLEEENILKFYDDSAENTFIVEEVMLPNMCKNLPETSQRKVFAVETMHCITLYEEDDCLGKNFTLRPHSAVKLDENFNKITASFSVCMDFKTRTELGLENLFDLPTLQLYANEDHTDLLLEAPIKDGCTTIQANAWRKTTSIKSETCVQLYSLHYCQGESVVFLPGSKLDSSFYQMVVSFTACEDKLYLDNHNGVPKDKEGINDAWKEVAKSLRGLCALDREHPYCNTCSRDEFYADNTEPIYV